MIFSFRVPSTAVVKRSAPLALVHVPCVGSYRYCWKSGDVRVRLPLPSVDENTGRSIPAQAKSQSYHSHNFFTAVPVPEQYSDDEGSIVPSPPLASSRSSSSHPVFLEQQYYCIGKRNEPSSHSAVPTMVVQIVVPSVVSFATTRIQFASHLSSKPHCRRS